MTYDIKEFVDVDYDSTVDHVVPKRVARRRITKNRKKGGESASLYFDERTQSAIVQFQYESDPIVKNRVYEESILPSFRKLVENLIYIYGFCPAGESVDVIREDCLSFLYENLSKWDARRGTKAFSYFNVVAKHWLIITCRRKVRTNRKFMSIDDTDVVRFFDKMCIEDDLDLVTRPDFHLNKHEFRRSILLILDKIKALLVGDNEQKCLLAIRSIFDAIDELDVLNKRAIFVYVRDSSGLTAKQLSTSMSNIRRMYAQLKSEGKIGA